MRHRLKIVSRRLAVTAAISFLATVGTMGGCADQQEGDRCTFFNGGDAGENGTSECAAGLVCTTANAFSGVAVTPPGMLGVCCPVSGPFTSAACVVPSGTGGRPTGDGSSFDSGVDASPDGTIRDGAGDTGHASDAAIDANGDAKGEAGHTTDASGDATDAKKD